MQVIQFNIKPLDDVNYQIMINAIHYFVRSATIERAGRSRSEDIIIIRHNYLLPYFENIFSIVQHLNTIISMVFYNDIISK